MNSLLILLADTAAADPAAGKEGGGSLLGNPLMMLPLILLVFYFIVMRPMQKQKQELQAMTTNLKKNDKVLTTSGIYGIVVAVSETDDEVTIKVDDNTRLKITKGTVGRNLSREEEAKQAKEKPKEQKEGGA